MSSASVLNLDFASLGDPQFLEQLDYDTILARRKAKLISLFADAADFINLETEPMAYLLEEASFTEMLMRGRLNDAYMQSLLPYAIGNDLDYIAAFWGVTRIAASGSDPAESDDHLRRRTWLGIVGRSPGGTAERYRFVAMSSSVEVADAICWCDPISPLVHVAVVSTASDGVASSDLLATVTAALNATDVKLVNDTLTVVSAVTQTVNITADLWALPGTDVAITTSSAAAIRAAWAAEGGLGRDIVPAWVIARGMIDGVQRLENVVLSTSGTVDPHSMLAMGTITLTLKGTDY